MKKVSRFYLKAVARDIPPNTVIYKEPPDQRARKLTKPYTITNKITLYSDDKREISQEATKMLYLIDENGKVSFIPPEYPVSVGFDSLEELEEFLPRIKSHAKPA
jgi:hypothetical protein